MKVGWVVLEFYLMSIYTSVVKKKWNTSSFVLDDTRPTTQGTESRFLFWL